jgi:membrane carboxypeptidase/penicillin-binding protein
MIQEGLRGVIRLPEGTAHRLDSRDFPIPVMGKTGTTSDFHDALFVGSTYGRQGITVAVRIGFDDNRTLGDTETGGRTALPIFREVMLHVYERQLVGPVPQFPREIEARIDEYLARQAALKTTSPLGPPPEVTPTQSGAGGQRVAGLVPSANSVRPNHSSEPPSMRPRESPVLDGP